MTLHAAATPLLSNVTGTWMTDEEATDPRCGRGRSGPPSGSPTNSTDARRPGRVLVEVGPGGSLTGSAVRHPKWSDRAPRRPADASPGAEPQMTATLSCSALGQLWSAGVDVDWSPLRRRQPPRVSLPGYPFARQRHWVEPEAHRSGGRFPPRQRPPVGDRRLARCRDTVQAGGTAVADRGDAAAHLVASAWASTSIDRNDNFFDLGGDSLMAIGVAMSATNEGLELTPQDLYDHPSLAALAAASPLGTPPAAWRPCRR